MSISFLLTAFVIVASPGTGVLVTVSAGLSQGKRAALMASLGCTLGIVPHLLAAITGLAALLHTSALAFQVLKYAGVAYLLLMAWRTLKEHGALQLDTPAALRSDRRIVVSAILANLLNPKLSIFFLAFLPQFVNPDGAHPLFHMLTLSGVFMGLTLLVFAFYGVFAASTRDHVLARPSVLRWMRRSFAAAFVGLGARLAFSER